jgi:hypothetical protein
MLHTLTSLHTVSGVEVRECTRGRDSALKVAHKIFAWDDCLSLTLIDCHGNVVLSLNKGDTK